MKHEAWKFAVVFTVVLIVGSVVFGSSQDDAYMGLSHGKTDVLGQRARFIGVNVGSNVSDRVSLGAFAQLNLLSDFPGYDAQVDITETEAAYAFSAGMDMVVRMFRDAGLNPLLQLAVANTTIGYLERDEQTGKDSLVMAANAFTLQVATGFEIGIFDSLKFLCTHGYRYVAHGPVLDLPVQALSGRYNSFAFRIECF